MGIVRALLAWYFAFCAIVLLFGAFTGPWESPWRGHSDLIYVAVRHVIPASLGIVFGVATHVAARGRLTAKLDGKAWTISASLLSLLITIGFPFYYIKHGGASAFWSMQEFFGIPTALGIVGLVAFSLHRDHTTQRTISCR